MAHETNDHDLIKERGLIAWMTRNRITPNLMMLIFLVGGFLTALRIKQEVFPEFDLDMVTISVAYPGSSPEEVEQGIVLAVEEGIRVTQGFLDERLVLLDTERHRHWQQIPAFRRILEG